MAIKTIDDGPQGNSQSQGMNFGNVLAGLQLAVTNIPESAYEGPGEFEKTKEVARTDKIFSESQNRFGSMIQNSTTIPADQFNPYSTEEPDPFPGFDLPESQAEAAPTFAKSSTFPTFEQVREEKMPLPDLPKSLSAVEAVTEGPLVEEGGRFGEIRLPVGDGSIKSNSLFPSEAMNPGGGGAPNGKWDKLQKEAGEKVVISERMKQILADK